MKPNFMCFKLLRYGKKFDIFISTLRDLSCIHFSDICPDAVDVKIKTKDVFFMIMTLLHLLLWRVDFFQNYPTRKHYHKFSIPCSISDLGQVYLNHNQSIINKKRHGFSNPRMEDFLFDLIGELFWAPDDRESNKPPSKGTTMAHIVELTNKVFDIVVVDDLSRDLLIPATTYGLVVFVDFVANLSDIK
ncbi:hypothetical protein BY458DRAFT_551177 [Sporodiniella umbellata]|nr:hypothetical protein BY458DRAFT_551177 [Sporodiniella umbellata]